jgi:hypothetical protein
VTGKPNLSFYSDIESSKQFTQVVHFKKSDYDVYIGRPSKWGNPFSHKEDTIAEFRVENRQTAIQQYEKWVLTQSHLMRSLIELRGKTLGCWCSPKPCHGHVLAKLIERYVD